MKEGGIERQKSAVSIINEALQDLSADYPNLLRTLSAAGHSMRGKGETLRAAKGIGRMSAEMNMGIMGLMRELVEPLGVRVRRDNQNAPQPVSFINKIREYATAEPDISDMLRRYAELAPRAESLETIARVKGPEMLDHEDQTALSEFNKINLPGLSRTAPAQMLLHFYDNGDLKFIWGMKDDDSPDDIGQRTAGFRYGTNYSNPSDAW